MQYLLLIYANENQMPADGNALFKAYGDYTANIIKSGNMRGGNALVGTTNATTVRVRDGKTLSTDGPFAETKEQLGGYYLVDAKDLDEAIKLAARIPSATFGSIEVRPIREMPADYPKP
jgi:hypothetical protein